MENVKNMNYVKNPEYKKYLKKISALTAIFLLVSVTIVFPVSAAQVTISYASVEPEESITVPILIDGVNSLAGAHILMTYDPTVVQVTGVGNSDLDFETYRDIDNDGGYLRYVAVNLLSALEGPTIKFADVTLKGVGEADELCTMDIMIISMQDEDFNEIPYTAINGTFRTYNPTPTPTSTPAPTPTTTSTTTPTPTPTSTPTPMYTPFFIWLIRWWR
ncbi:MAG: cohesin domain-containing protein [Halobacteriota archaeon]|nr:cohesin domain-containing protein [Halobacteriota archaeon]